jgi:DNA-directed RNA polymerase subunit K
MHPTALAGTLSGVDRSYTTYIKGTNFRGYLLREAIRLKYTRFERARIIGARALQISLGAPTLVEVSEETIDPIEISIMEFDKGVIPMTVKRD